MPERESSRSIPSPSLHACMVGLVLLNLVFVQLTEAASPLWLAPLYVLTLSSSLFARFKERMLYRSLWNLGVLGFFGLLVRHALSADLAFVLQDGLMLAALCQVHLLNNLHRDQRPDLLFLNSYLIAIITGYITVDLGFAGAFLLYVPFYIVGLQFLSVFRIDGALSWGDVRAIGIDGAKRSCVLLGLALLAFAFWPRDFEREALLVRYFEFSESDGPAKVDFSESLELGEKTGGGDALGEVAMTIAPLGGPILDLPTLWRGATLGRHLFDGSWSKLDERGSGTSDPVWEFTDGGRRAARPGAHGPSRSCRVVRKGGPSLALFAPFGTAAVELAPIHRQGTLQARADGTLQYSNPGELRYQLTLQEVLGRAGADALLDLEPFLVLEESAHTAAARSLAEQLRRRLGDDAVPAQVARSFSVYLQKRYPYRLPIKGEEPPPANTLHQFLTTEAGGHCEFFASALATMLRSVEIPARVVTGFRVGAPDPESGQIVVRTTAAHAWVEAWTEDGWLTLDPTPSLDLDAGGESLLERASKALGAMWSRVTSFDAEGRARLYGWFGSLPGRLWQAAKGSPIGALGLLGAIAVLVLQRYRRRRARTPESVRDLARRLRALGLAPHRGETPRETLARAKVTEGLDPEAVEGLRRATDRHERARYADV